MTEKAEDLLFLDDDDSGCNAPSEPAAWKLLIVDDEAEVHNVTRLVLGGFHYRGRGLEFLSAYTGQEAKDMLAAHPDIAVILLDVVMEENDTGLKLVKYIREDLENRFVRIILRTGQPGQAPEERVIVEYDINDYKEKTELTAQKLLTTIVSALRTSSDIATIEANRLGLEKIIEASENIFELQSMEKFSTGVLSQLISILELNKNAIVCQASGFAAVNDKGHFSILAATGEYQPFVRKNVEDVVPPAVYAHFQQAVKNRTSLFFDGKRYIGYFRSQNDSESVIYLEGAKELTELDLQLVEIFFANVSIAFDNLHLNKEVEDTQREIVLTLGETIEWRSQETGNHVRRVAEYIYILARKHGLSEAEATLLRLAAPMHDVGKLGIPDVILNKPGPLTPNEMTVIRTHPTIGHEILKSSHRELLKAAAIISLQHHERYDGSGYPSGLAGEGIHIYGRLSAVADVFDALMSDRIYRPAWPLEQVIEHFKTERGRHFDPALTGILLDSLDDFLKVRELYQG
jgi:response regulator RpfG family c-di-GMP phosphodiesterase